MINVTLWGRAWQWITSYGYLLNSWWLKAVVCSFEEEVWIRREGLHWQFFFSMLKQTKWTNCLYFLWLNKRADLKGQHNVILFCFVYLWRTLPPFQLQTVFWRTYFPLRTACFIQLLEKMNMFEFVLLPHWYFKYYSSEFEILLQHHIVPLLVLSFFNWMDYSTVMSCSELTRLFSRFFFSCFFFHLVIMSTLLKST